MLALVFDNKWPGAAELILWMECCWGGNTRFPDHLPIATRDCELSISDRSPLDVFIG